MDSDSQVLKDKALLLISRERELMALRNKHQRLLNWLSLSQSLPELIDRRFSLAEIAAKFTKRIVSSIKLQRVHLLEFTQEGVRPLGTDQLLQQPPLSKATLTWLKSTRSGMVNDPESPPEVELATALRVHRMLFYRLDLWQDKLVLLGGGFDQERAISYMPFDQEDAEHFAHAGQHFESLLSNLLLLFELEREKQHLERFNDQLELRVRERTEELGLANQELTQALASLRDKDRRLGEDLEQARSFQQSILPTLPQETAIEFATIYQPLDQVGGDIYDVAALGEGRFRIFIADATGHGVQASMRTIVIKAEYDRIKHRHGTPESLLGELNQHLTQTYSEHEMICTACCVDITIHECGASVLYSNAGHPPLFHIGQAGVSECYHDGVFLGLVSDAAFELQGVELVNGDVLVIYTDGISEQINANRQQFGLDVALASCFGEENTVARGLEYLLKCFTEFRGPVALYDDITLVALRIAPRRHAVPEATTRQ